MTRILGKERRGIVPAVSHYSEGRHVCQLQNLRKEEEMDKKNEMVQRANYYRVVKVPRRSSAKGEDCALTI